MSASTLVTLAELLGAERRGKWYDAHCPAHDDERPSFSFTGTRAGTVLLCRAGCTPEAVAAALRKRFPQLELGKLAPRGKRTVVAAYPYHDENQNLVFEVVRYEPKDVKQRRPDGGGGHIWNVEGVRRVVYRLSDLKGHCDIWITEGEKDTDRLWEIGCPATTAPGGAGKWADEYVQQLKAQGVKNAFVIADNDEEGRKHARTVARSCFRAGMTVALINLPDVPEKGDVSDWLDQGHTRENLMQLTADSILDEPPSEDVEQTGQPGEAPPPAKGAAAQLLEATEGAGIGVFHTPLREPFVVVPVGDHKEVFPVHGADFKNWLREQEWRHNRRVPSQESLNAVLDTVAAQALFDGVEEVVHLRAAWHAGALYYDLCDPEWRAVRITAQGWQVVDAPPPRFRRYLSVTRRERCLYRSTRLCSSRPRQKMRLTTWRPC